jgi:uncharacterized membrane protein YhhN
MTAMSWWLVGCAANLAVLDWIAVARRRERIELIAKPATLIALIGAATAAEPSQSGVHAWLISALVLGLCGDVALMLEHRIKANGLFMLGLASFLVGHLSYIVAMLHHGTDKIGITLGLMLALTILSAFGYQVILGAFRQGGPTLAVAVALYMAALGSMLVVGIGTSSLWIAYGAIVFVASDLALGADRFVVEKPWSRLTVIITYHIAQLLLLLGLVDWPTR